MKYQSIVNRESEILALTGYTKEEFDSLLPYFKEALSNSKYTLEGKERKYKTTSYKNSAFPSLEDKLFFILVYYKQYATQSMMALTFGISQPKVNMWIHFLSPALGEALNKANVVPNRRMEELSLEKPSLFSHDGTERPIQRPKDLKETEEIL